MMERTNFKMEYENITMTRGDTLAFNCQIFDQNKEPVEADTAFFTCKERIGGEIVFQKSIGDGIEQDESLLTVRVAPEDTKDIEEGIYFYDFQIGVGNDVFTVKKGTLMIEWDAAY